MPLFRYKELSSQNKKNPYHFIDADDLAGAKKKLHELRIIAAQIESYDGFREKFSLSPKHLLMITKDFYYLLHSGLPLYESLLTLEEKYRGHKVYPMILDLADNVKYGTSLSSILSHYKRAISSIYCSMIRSAENSGHLDKAFLELAQMLEKNAKWQKKIRDTLTYPLFLFSFSLSILLGLFLVIIPSMKELFEDRALHPLTSAVLTISNWMTENTIALCAIGAAIATTIIASVYHTGLKKACKKVLYKISVINQLMTKISIERFATNLYNLLESSVPILEALYLSKETLNHPLLEGDVEHIIDLIKKGKKFSEAINSSAHFPPLVSKMISTGEHAGTIAPILAHLSELFHQEVKTALEKFTALLQPILLLLIGIIVGVVLLAVLIPLTDVSSLI